MITVEHLSKKYGDFQAVDDLSFSIEDGHVYGFLGPNGAGKSTTLNIITGCLAATSGDVKIDGFDIYENEREAKRCIGYLPEIPPLYVEQTPREYLKFVAEAKGISKKEIQASIDRVVAETHIEDVEKKLIKHLSKGYRQRVGIAQALLGNPSVIILDEPTVGLDPMQIIEIRDLITELGKKHTVILSSHILSEVQAICEKVLIIYKGKLVAFDDLDNLSRTFTGNCQIEIMAECTFEEAAECLDEIEEITKYELKENTDSGCKLIAFTDEEVQLDVCKNIMKSFINADKMLISVNPIKTTLEDIFIELTSQEQNLEDGISSQISLEDNSIISDMEKEDDEDESNI